MIIYPSPIFGPVHSRRLGISLGINLQPGDGKVCSFDCIYCECGLNDDNRPKSKRPSREAVADALEQKLKQMVSNNEIPDVLTFAGNGEPTGHPDFLNIIRDTVRLRDRYCPKAKVSVLSNATFCGRPDVREALMLVDNNILKLDTIDDDYIRLVDRPTQSSYKASEVVEWMKAYDGHCIVQTMFMTSSINKAYENIGEEYVQPWLEALQLIAPQQVMIYTVDRETPFKELEKATPETLDSIRDRVIALGIPCTASY